MKFNLVQYKHNLQTVSTIFIIFAVFIDFLYSAQTELVVHNGSIDFVGVVLTHNIHVSEGLLVKPTTTIGGQGG